MLQFTAHRLWVQIDWTWNVDSDEDYLEPGDIVKGLMDVYRKEISKEICLIEDMDDETWQDFTGGMSTFSNHVERMLLEYYPCSGAMLTLFKNLCSKCDRSCGLAETYCDGTGKPLSACSDCGTTDHRHGPNCVWSVASRF